MMMAPTVNASETDFDYQCTGFEYQCPQISHQVSNDQEIDEAFPCDFVLNVSYEASSIHQISNFLVRPFRTQ